jgi:hypothetical protein
MPAAARAAAWARFSSVARWWCRIWWESDQSLMRPAIKTKAMAQARV